MNFQQIVIDNQFNFWIDAFIPFICAVIGGILALVGVIVTIRHENKKSKQDYIERIRPFFTVDTYLLTNVDTNKIRDIIICDDCEQDKTESSIVYHLNGFMFSNVGEAVCIIEYLRINGKKIDCWYRIPLKPNESARMVGKPFSLYYAEESINSIEIGVSDRLLNRYEYPLQFETKNTERKDGVLHERNIEIISIDCSSNII